MRTKADYGEVLKHGVASESGFNIKTTATAFKILSEGLYSDKILAFVRELACNAYDAHVAAGNQHTPMQVHLPTSLEPYFEIKDFGIGLHQNDVFGLYTTYFESTKSNSDEFIGQMGLGSKSPFAYCDQFSVSSRFNGEEHHFTAFIDDTGIPAIALLNSNATDEHNGLTIRLPIRQHDFSEVNEKVKRIFQRFDPKPVIRGGTITWATPETPISSGKGWRIYPNDWHRHKARAVMGLVEYYATGYQHVNALEHRMLETNMEIDFAIGDLSVTASRESISFDKPTVAAFHKRLTEIKNELAVKIEDEIHSQPTLWHAAIKRNEISNQNHLNYAVVGNSKIQWRGTAIPKDFVYKISDKVKIDHFWCKRNQVTFKREACDTELCLMPKTNIEIYYNALGEVFRAHTRKRISQRDRNYVHYVIHKKPDTTLAEFELELANICQTLGGVELKNLLDIEIVRQPRGTKTIAVPEHRKIHVLYSEIRSKKYGYVDAFVDEKLKDFLDGNASPWYIPVSANHAVLGENADGSYHTHHSIYRAFELLRVLGLSVPKSVAAILVKRVKKLPNNWVNAFDKIREFALKKETQEKIDTIFGCQSVIKQFREFVGHYYEDEAKKVTGFEMEEIFNLYQNAKNTQATYKNMMSMDPLMHLLKAMSIDIQTTTNARMETLIKRFTKKYPLLLMVPSYERWRNHAMANEYIQAINLMEQHNNMQGATTI
jgi:hypothetical protein